MKTMLTFAVCLTLTAYLQSQVIIRVTPTGTGNGTSWTNACNLEEAIAVIERSRNAASLNDRTEIWVQKGTYYPSKMLIVPDSVKIYGGFAGVETALSQRNFAANPTVIDGQQKIGSIFRLENSVTIDGFTIQNGNANGNPHKNGGGVWADENTVIANCIIRNNSAIASGGGVYAKEYLTLIGSTVENNTASNGANLYGNCITELSIPVIVTHPDTAKKSVEKGGSFPALSVSATSKTPLSYQWFSNTAANNVGGTNLGSNDGAQTDTYTPQGSTAGILYYYCEITNSDSTIKSDVSGLHAVTAPPITVAGCNSGTFDLGTVSFRTPVIWAISGNGVEQEWSDVVMATGCNKTTYTGGVANNWNTDCRNNLSGHGDLFSWCAVKRFAAQLCPTPWRTPTNQDFCDLDKALGGPQPCALNTYYTNATIRNKYVGTSGTEGQFWGATYSRMCDANGVLAHGCSSQACVFYWTQSLYGANNPYYVAVNSNNVIYPQYSTSNAGFGLLLRCVR